MSMTTPVRAAALALLVAGAQSALADNATQTEAVAMVKKGVAFIKSNGHNPLKPMAARLEEVWGDVNLPQQVVWPLALRIGVNEKN